MIEIREDVLLSIIEDQLKTCTNLVSNLSNIASMIYHCLKDFNWVGFYLAFDDILLVGPFQGKPACTQIKKGMGVCGESFLRKETIIVDDCSTHPNYIACDNETCSEIVIPILKNNEVVMVLDIDSPLKSRFNDIKTVEILHRVKDLLECSLNNN
jgi:GAF domain-containing protein